MKETLDGLQLARDEASELLAHLQECEPPDGLANAEELDDLETDARVLKHRIERLMKRLQATAPDHRALS